MIISVGRKYIFVHAPKTGGTSLSLALEDRAMAGDVLIGDTPKALRRKKRVQEMQAQAKGRLWKHSTLADIDGVVALQGMVIVTLVRNPWDRMVSYYHWLRMQSWEHPAVRAAKSGSFDQFLEDRGVVQSIQRAHFGHYVTDAKGQEREALFIRLEHLEQDLRAFERHLGFALSPLAMVNRSDRGPHRDYYNSRTRAIVAEICGPDIARFSYEF